MRGKLAIAAGILGFLVALTGTYMVGDLIRDEWFGGVPRGWDLQGALLADWDRLTGEPVWSAQT